MRYEAWVNAIRASSFIENFPQISAKPITFQHSPTKSAVPNQSFFSETGLKNSHEIPAKSAVFPANLSLKIPRNLTFFSATYQKPWLQRRATNSQTNFPCHLKVNSNKLALINHLWKYKTGERLTITTNSCTKIDLLDGFRPL